MKYCLFELENRSVIDLLQDDGDQIEAYEKIKIEMLELGYKILESDENFFSIPSKLLVSGGKNPKYDLFSVAKKTKLYYKGGTIFSD